MRLIIVGLALLGAAIGCGSAQGQTTDGGGGGSNTAYAVRQQVHCTTATMLETMTSVEVYCSDFGALPLSGSCQTNAESDQAPTSLSVTLAVNQPLNWEGTAGIAGWRC